MSLGKEMQSLVQEISRSHENRQEGIARLQEEVKEEVNRLARSRQSLARELQARLRQICQGRAEGEKKRRQGRAEGEKKRRQEIQGELAQVREAWQGLTPTLQAGKGAGASSTARAEAEEITAELAGLKERVFAHLAGYPNGTRMTELEEKFGLARIRLARIVRSLLDENKVEKRGLLYFAI